MLSVEDWAEIRRLRRSEQLSISEVSRVMGVARNTVKAALASDRPPTYQRVSTGSIVDAAEPGIGELLAAYPRMPATVIAERIGWQYPSARSASGCASCGRCICRRTRPRARRIRLGRSRSATCGSPTFRFRSVTVRRARPRRCRC